MLGPYSATKFAVRALTQAAAKEHAADGITVNAYCPGVVGTDMWVEIDKRFAELTGAAEGETYEKFVGGIALGRAETPEDVAGFVVLPGRPGRRLHDRAGRADRRRHGLPLSMRVTPAVTGSTIGTMASSHRSPSPRSPSVRTRAATPCCCPRCTTRRWPGRRAPARPRDVIADSWKRLLGSGIDPEHHDPPDRGTSGLELLRQSSGLMAVLEDISRGLESVIADGDNILVVADATRPGAVALRHTGC